MANVEDDTTTTQQPEPEQEELTQIIPHGLTPETFTALKPSITKYHKYPITTNPAQCSSLLAQPIKAPPQTVWSILRRFDRPQTYKHFIKTCTLRNPQASNILSVGDLRDVHVISGLPAATSTERLDMLDEETRVTGFSIIGGDHRLRNYKSVTSVHEMMESVDGDFETVVLESYVVDVPDGNTEEDTRLFADTVVKLNLQKLGSVAEAAYAAAVADEKK